MAQIVPRRALLHKANPSVPLGTLPLLLKVLSVLQSCVFIPPGSLAVAWMCLRGSFRRSRCRQGCVSGPGPARHPCSFLHPSQPYHAGAALHASPSAAPFARRTTSPWERLCLCQRDPGLLLPTRLDLRGAPGDDKPAWSQTTGANAAVPSFPGSVSHSVPPACRVSSAGQSAWSWSTRSARGAARFRRRTGTSASTAASRNASRWACRITVSVTAARRPGRLGATGPSALLGRVRTGRLCVARFIPWLSSCLGIIFQMQCFEPVALHPLLLQEKGLFTPVQAGCWHIAVSYGLAQGQLDAQIALLCWDF